MAGIPVLLVLALFVPQDLKGSSPGQGKEPKRWRDFCCWEKGRVVRGDLVSVLYDLHHKNLQEFQKVLSPYLTPGRGRIEFSDPLKTLIVTDTKANIGVLERMLQMIHHAEPPILIEAKVVELRWSKDLQIGIEGDLNSGSALFLKDAGSRTFLRDVRVNLDPQEALASSTPFQGSTFRFFRDKSGSQYGGLLNLFQERGKAQILSQPRILVKADEAATIFAGDEVPYPQQIQITPGGTTTTLVYRPSGVSLQVTPHLASPGMVLLHLKPEVTTTLGFVQITENTQAPQFTVRRADTRLLVRTGEEVVIGGLYRKEKTTTRRGLPFLMDIPILGYLFSKYEDKETIQEILFFIKPTIIERSEDMPRRLIDPDK